MPKPSSVEEEVSAEASVSAEALAALAAGAAGAAAVAAAAAADGKTNPSLFYFFKDLCKFTYCFG